MTEAQSRKYTPQKEHLDNLEANLQADIRRNQQQIANVQRDNPNYQELRTQLLSSQMRLHLELDPRTLFLLEDIATETQMDLEEVIARNNVAQDRQLRGEAWVTAIIDGLN